jgi:hypothetical protein
MNDYGGMVRQLLMAATPIADKFNPVDEKMNPVAGTEGVRGYSGGSGFKPQQLSPQEVARLTAEINAKKAAEPKRLTPFQMQRAAAKAEGEVGSLAKQYGVDPKALAGAYAEAKNGAGIFRGSERSLVGLHEGLKYHGVDSIPLAQALKAKLGW